MVINKKVLDFCPACHKTLDF